MKILLNSLYGALLNNSCRFFDQRIGQSVTLTGRMISRHQCAKVNEIITGIYDHLGEANIYADTDSNYFSAYNIWKKDKEKCKILQNRDEIVKAYNEIGEKVNESFEKFMVDHFHVSSDRGKMIKSAREIVASAGLFIKKKKYAVLYYDKDKKRYDTGNKPGKIKAMGLDLKRSDTPKIMQVFLEGLLFDVLTDASENEVINKIKNFRDEFRKRPGWEKGSPKKVNALSDYADRFEKAEKAYIGKEVKKVNLPGHVRASINWNKLKAFAHDNYSMEIQDGQKIIVCKLKKNPWNMTSIAYPIDEPHLPKWFRDLAFDHEEMENVIIDKKVLNLIGVLNWDLNKSKSNPVDDLFDFG